MTGEIEIKQLKKERVEHRKRLAKAKESPLAKDSPLPCSNLIDGVAKKDAYLPVPREIPENTVQATIVPSSVLDDVNLLKFTRRELEP